MKKAILAILLLTSALAVRKTKPNPADYTIAVHVQSSRMVVACSDVPAETVFAACSSNSTSPSTERSSNFNRNASDLLRVGDYKAKSQR